jgi:hypothetical protein
MMLRQFYRAPATLACALMFALSAAWAGPAKQSGLTMEVESDYFGNSTMRVSKDGIRIDSKKLGISIVSHAPGWSVILFNERSKSYYEATLEEWKKRVASRAGMKHGKQEIKLTGSAKIEGQKVKVYRWVDDTTRSGRKKPNPVSTDLYAMQSLLVPKEAAAVLASASDLPPDFGLPMRITRSQLGMKKASMVLDTLKCKEGAIAKTVFFQPKGFKRVSSEVALIMEGDDDMGDLMDGLNTK